MRFSSPVGERSIRITSCEKCLGSAKSKNPMHLERSYMSNVKRTPYIRKLGGGVVNAPDKIRRVRRTVAGKDK